MSGGELAGDSEQSPPIFGFWIGIFGIANFFGIFFVMPPSEPISSTIPFHNGLLRFRNEATNGSDPFHLANDFLSRHFLAILSP